GSTNRVGDRLTLSAVIEGGTPISLQWLKDGAIIPGATSNSFSIPNLVASNSAGYSLYASNAFGTVTSSVATVLVIPDAAPDLRSGILSWWSMDDVAGDENEQGITLDSYGHNHFRTVGPGDFLDLVPGMFLNAIQFNGVNQYCLRTRGFPTYNNPSYTIAFWVNASASQVDRRIFSESHTNNTNSVISFGSQTNGANGTLRVLIRNDVGLTLLDRSSTRTVLDDTWHHVVWTETNNEVRLFIDGVLDETSFSYPRVGLSLNATTVGALLNALGAANFLNGLVDEVAVWGRALSHTEVQVLRTNTVPEPLADSAPIVTGPPASQSVFTYARVTFSFAASGTGPLYWNWRREGTNLPGQTNATLVLSNLTPANAGNYDVVVTNALGGATSQVAVLTIMPIDLKVDVNNLGVDNTPANTEAAFSPFILDVTAPITLGPVTRVFNGAEVTLSAIGGINMQSRKRPQPVNTGAFTEERLLQDFIFAADAALGQGLDIAIDFLGANQNYTLTIWSFDNLNNGRFSDWSANSTTLTNGYTFTGSTQPTDNASSQFTRNVTADSNGRILIQARRGASATAANNVFLNALRLTPAPVAPEIRVLAIQLTTTNTLRLTIGGINPGATHRIEQKAIVTDAWVNVPEATFGAPNGNVLEAIIPVPDTATRFYHVVEEP
ncbi:MAG TPA: LamG-like jellyroll fold domain-containing protein, partial [Verrucomicrobiae bacterium]